MMLEGLGHTQLSLANAVVLIVVNFALDIALVPRLGVLGAAIGTATALSVRVFAGVLEIRYLYGITPYTATLAQVLLAGIPALFVGGIIATQLSSQLLLIGLLPVGVTLSYAVTLYVLSPFTHDDRLVAERIDDRLGWRLVTRVLSYKKP
jgi:O-antigen/teichoic acid export membrane protein